MLKGKYLNLYKKVGTDGTLRTVFRYLLSGSPDALKRYEAILKEQGVLCHKDEKTGQIIYFTTVCHADNIEIDITDNDKIVVVNDTIEKLESKLQLVQDPTLKQAMANRIAEMVLGVSAPAASNAVAAATPVAAAEEAPAAEDEANL